MGGTSGGSARRKNNKPPMPLQTGWRPPRRMPKDRWCRRYRGCCAWRGRRNRRRPSPRAMPMRASTAPSRSTIRTTAVPTCAERPCARRSLVLPRLPHGERHHPVDSDCGKGEGDDSKACVQHQGEFAHRERSFIANLVKGSHPRRAPRWDQLNERRLRFVLVHRFGIEPRCAHRLKQNGP